MAENRIVGFTFTHNEEKIVPIVMQYWDRIKPDKLIVLDNLSTDDTVKLLKKYPYVEVAKYDTDGHFNEVYLTWLRNNVWKDVRGFDWVIITDFDEVPYCEKDLRDYLDECDANIIRTRQYNVIREDFPKEGELVHLQEGNRFNSQGIRMDKIHLFKPSELKDINYELGMHYTHQIPREGFDIRYTEYPQKLYFYHLKYLGKEYALDRAKDRDDRVSIENKRAMINIHYHKMIENYDSEIAALGKIYDSIKDLENER